MASERQYEREAVLPHFWKLWEALIPACSLCGFAGSLRRGVPLVSDIEIVAVPFFDTVSDLFEEQATTRTYSRLSEVLQLLLDAGVLRWDEQTKRNGNLYKRFVLPALGGIGVDLFLADQDNYGYILALRTGPADWSHALVTPREKGGLRPPHLRCKDGYLWRQTSASSGVVLAMKFPVPSEGDFFDAWAIPRVNSPDRTAEKVHALRHGLGLPYVPTLRMVGATSPSPARQPQRMEASA
jgi:hypothetical protein